MYASIGAVLAGGMFGDHCSPISDTTILASSGAGCDHVDHVKTQIPYALINGAASFIGYILAGVTGSALSVLFSLGLLIGIYILASRYKGVKMKDAEYDAAA